MGVGVSGIGSAGVIPLTSALIDGGLAELGKKTSPFSSSSTESYA